MKSRNWRDDGSHNREGRVPEVSNNKKKKMKNMQRLGGAGLSLEAFANAKSRNNAYNPALLKKKREFYKNAKHVNKYKKLLKQQSQPNDQDSVEPAEISKENKKNRKGSYSLRDLYVKKHEEQEKARMEREANYKAKKEEKERAESRRKDLREKMFKRTRRGQPVMKYRIEHLLETIQGLAS
ncbi:hypothetical protein BVRB_7g180030 [Beta vulgaris subsp. vulgaris]|uniref:rRNA-processing protein FYV7 n=1 Tax=Beta vulgaris subsp. vulgaris TaxID=3555 RepID=A0A0J8E1H5_BETVV|nr:hypothetical protein BVRB_7g180030 [Beta vulgaris subsp. vulgaris]